MVIAESPEALEDDDILHMVNAGLVDSTVVDDFVAECWSDVLQNIRQNKSAAVRTGGEIATAVRKDNPTLLQAVNAWIKKHGARTAFGNMMERRSLQSMAYVKNAAAESERRKLREMVKLFQTYGSKYNVDFLMAAQGYRESDLNISR